MSTQHEKATRFSALHVRGNPLVLFNVWDVGSARAVAAAGAQALATGSWSVAAANGYADGERLPLRFALDNLARVVLATELPVSVDLESGYGNTADEVASTISRSIEAGAIGCNLEDSDAKSGGLRDIREQGARLASARKAAGHAGVPFFINARSDVFFAPTAQPATDDERVVQVLARAHAYAEAGANGLFVPGLTNRGLIERLVAQSPLPLNVMVSDQTPSLAELAALGVARVSHGPRPYLAMMKNLQEAARDAMAVK